MKMLMTRIIPLLALPLSITPWYRTLLGPDGFAKGEEPENEDVDMRRLENVGQFKLQCGSFMIPEKSKRNGGEDACFARPNAAGVFDGVGGWSRRGVDAGKYSRALSAATVKYLDELGPEKLGESLSKAAKENTNMGSSTACLISLNPDGKLNILNLGDSGISIFRDLKLAFRSEEQQLAFNHPYQLGTSSPHTVSDAASFDLHVKQDDVIILATDGAYDNLHDAEVATLVQQTKNDSEDVAAEKIAKAALVNGENRYYDSPFAQHARKTGHLFYGGKTDDITVVFCRACATVDPENPPLPRSRL